MSTSLGDPSGCEPGPAIQTLAPRASAYIAELVAYVERSAPELGHEGARALVAGVAATHASALPGDPAAWTPAGTEPGGRPGVESGVLSMAGTPPPVASHAMSGAVRSTAGDADVEPVLSVDNPIVRSVISTIMCTFYSDRLLQYAERCLAWQRRTTAVEPADLVQTSLGFLLAGDIARSISTEEVLRSLLVTIRNLSRNLRKHERFADTDSDALDRVADSLDAFGACLSGSPRNRRTGGAFRTAGRATLRRHGMPFSRENEQWSTLPRAASPRRPFEITCCAVVGSYVRPLRPITRRYATRVQQAPGRGLRGSEPSKHRERREFLNL